ncbi:ABC-2 type transport system permease protein [Anseongella ginsenosidimutans]|uniref:ABC-2 type transport system permease protein n=1 Tax=Anseongella ginsenosidimutans TaxID=496056 RepID=A0A4R3KUN3_9SPHI|nr:ABC transporter permease [Anseongella ginsenosidimutans]TCS89005.1 ABC-2 type transport system permease protein [Anseongella ginsenosidimutans]
MNVLRFILQKEFRQIFRDRTILAMMLAVPTIQLIILPLAMNFEVKNVNISVVDHDHSSWSQKLITKIASSGYFRMVSADPSYQEALTHIEKGEADLVLEIPAGFERNLVREGSQQLGIYVDAINGTKAFIGGNYLNSVIRDFNAGLRLNVPDAGQAGLPPAAAAAKIQVTYSNWFNPLGEYKYYIVPGILVILLTMVGGFMSSLNIVREKEAGTIEQINVTPIKKWEFILGKLIPFWIIGMIVFTIGLLVCRGVYGIFPEGSLALLYLFAAFYLVAVLGFGLLVSTYSDSQIQAMFIAFFFVMIFILMSGLFTSVESMPAWARTIANLTPVTHFIKVVRMIVLKGSGFTDVLPEFLYIMLFAAILNGWAILNYKKTS